MKVFVGWSGDLSRKVASILHKYLPLIDREFGVFVSEHDIESGARWGRELASRLDESNFGILCLSQDNLNESWILFEAGALTKHVEGHACGLLLGGLRPANIGGPLAQFQHRSFDETGLRTLLNDMNAKLDPPLAVDQLRTLFDTFWPIMKAEYDTAVTETGQTQVPETQRPDRELLEEVLRLMRGLVKSGTQEYRIEADYSGVNPVIHLLSLGNGPAKLLVDMYDYEKVGDQVAADGLARLTPHNARVLDEWDILIRSKDNLLCINPNYRSAFIAAEDHLRSKAKEYSESDAKT